MNKHKYMHPIQDSYDAVYYGLVNVVGEYIYKSNFIQFPRVGFIAIL